jgi:hypothetical protein
MNEFYSYVGRGKSEILSFFSETGNLRIAFNSCSDQTQQGRRSSPRESNRILTQWPRTHPMTRFPLGSPMTSRGGQIKRPTQDKRYLLMFMSCSYHNCYMCDGSCEVENFEARFPCWMRDNLCLVSLSFPILFTYGLEP